MTATAGIRLITFDRAGYGASSPLGTGAVPTVAGHAADAAAVLDHLGLGAVDLPAPVAVGDDQDHGFRVGMAAQMPGGEQ